MDLLKLWARMGRVKYVWMGLVLMWGSLLIILEVELPGWTPMDDTPAWGHDQHFSFSQQQGQQPVLQGAARDQPLDPLALSAVEALVGGGKDSEGRERGTELFGSRIKHWDLREGWKALPRKGRGQDRVCMVVDSAEAGKSDMVPTVGSLLEVLRAEFREVVVLLSGAEKCDEDGLDREHSMCSDAVKLSLLLQNSGGGAESSTPVRVAWLPAARSKIDTSPPVARSLQVFEWLQDNKQYGRCSTAHFLTPHLAHFALMARQQRVSLEETAVVVHYLKTHAAYKVASRDEDWAVEDLEIDFMEASAAARADLVVVDDLALAHEVAVRVTENIVGARGFEFEDVEDLQDPRPRRGAPAGVVLPLPASPIARKFGNADFPAAAQIGELVYWGPLGTAEGLVTFVHAVDEIAGWITRSNNAALARGCQVAFIGDSLPVSLVPVHPAGGEKDMLGDAYILQQVERWKSANIRVVIKNKISGGQAIKYIKSASAGGISVVVVAAAPGSAGGSRRARECQAARLPFVLLHGDDPVGGTLRAEPRYVRPREIAQRLKTLLVSSRGSGDRESFQHSLAGGRTDKILSEKWRELYRQLPRGGQPVALGERALEDSPLVTVCLVTHNRARWMTEAAESIMSQSYLKVELIIFDNGSTDGEVPAALRHVKSVFDSHLGLDGRSVKVVRSERLSLGAARNAAAKAGSGEWVLFMDDDNLATRDELKMLVKAAMATGAPIVTSGDDYFDGNSGEARGAPPPGRWFPVGGAVSVGTFRDGFGDANMLIRRGVLEEVGGFREDWDSTGEDWEMLGRAVMMGFDLQVVPLSLFLYRRSPTSMVHTTSRALYRERTLRPYAEALPAPLRPALRVARSAFFGGGGPGKGGSRAEARGASPLETALAQLRVTGQRCTLESDKMFGVSVGAILDLDMRGMNFVKNPRFRDLNEALVLRDSNFNQAVGWEPFGEGYELEIETVREKPEGGAEFEVFNRTYRIPKWLGHVYDPELDPSKRGRTLLGVRRGGVGKSGGGSPAREEEKPGAGAGMGASTGDGTGAGAGAGVGPEAEVSAPLHGRAGSRRLLGRVLGAGAGRSEAGRSGAGSRDKLLDATDKWISEKVKKDDSKDSNPVISIVSSAHATIDLGHLRTVEKSIVLECGVASSVRGAMQVVRIGQTVPGPLLVSARSKAEGVEESGSLDSYSMYIDITYTDGSSGYGFVVPFQGGTSEQWRAEKAIIVPSKPVESISLYLLLRYRTGTARFESVTVRRLLMEEVCMGSALVASMPRSQAAALMEKLCEEQDGCDAIYTPGTAMLL
mmetsp:Transcript_29579/g.94924  ORF Transcript_29579/g.94924 Transcript_29579/m.94924 type:complete len:1298 (+) Transcript_29579:176-4069(+)